jgi:hypothetical protein
VFAAGVASSEGAFATPAVAAALEEVGEGDKVKKPSPRWADTEISKTSSTVSSEKMSFSPTRETQPSI